MTTEGKRINAEELTQFSARILEKLDVGVIIYGSPYISLCNFVIDIG